MKWWQTVQGGSISLLLLRNLILSRRFLLFLSRARLHDELVHESKLAIRFYLLIFITSMNIERESNERFCLFMYTFSLTFIYSLAIIQIFYYIPFYLKCSGGFRTVNTSRLKVTVCDSFEWVLIKYKFGAEPQPYRIMGSESLLDGSKLCLQLTRYNLSVNYWIRM